MVFPCTKHGSRREGFQQVKEPAWYVIETRSTYHSESEGGVVMIILRLAAFHHGEGASVAVVGVDKPDDKRKEQLDTGIQIGTPVTRCVPRYFVWAAREMEATMDLTRQRLKQ